MSYVSPAPRLQKFLLWLGDADPSELCYPPGLGGVWLAKWIKRGLEQEVLVVHHAGLGLAYAVPDAHKPRHCSCKLCEWETAMRLADHGTQVSEAKIRDLRERLLRLSRGEKLPVVTLDG